MSSTRVSKRPVVLLTGKLPPPWIGPAVATSILLNSRLREEFELIHFDTSDPRDINTLGAIDARNIVLALRHYIKLARIIRKTRPDLVYMPVGQTTIGYGRDAGFIWIAKLFGRKVLCHLRGGNFRNWYNSAGPLTRWFVRLTHRRVDGQVVLGRNLRTLYDGLVPDQRIFVVPNGGDFPEREACAHSRLRVLYLSNFQRAKGVLDLLYAIPFVCAKHGAVEFVFAGSWRDAQTEREFRKFLDTHDELPVRLAGPITGDAKFEILASSDIFVLPTWYPNEGQPWAIIEAMRYGMPIISTAHAAIPETVSHGLNGFLVEQHNSSDIAKRIIQLIEDPNLRARMGAESRRLYRENFTEARMVERMAAAFRQVITAESR